MNYKVLFLSVTILIFLMLSACNLPLPTDSPPTPTQGCAEKIFNAQYYNSEYDQDGDCYLNQLLAPAAYYAQYTVDDDSGDDEFMAWLESSFQPWLDNYPWDCNDNDAAIGPECQDACASLGFNIQCYDSAYDMDGDCCMMEMAADSVCGYTLKNDYGQDAFDNWLVSYPWDTDDNNPQVCAAPQGCEAQSFNVQCYDSAYDMDGDCCMMEMAADSVCGYTLKNDYGQDAFDNWLVSYPWDTDDNNPQVCAAPQGCEAQSFNVQCYDSAYDMDGDCHMTEDSSLSVCGYTLQNDYGEEAFNDWIEIYPWDCDDNNPAIWVDCPTPSTTASPQLAPTVKPTQEPPPTRDEPPPQPTDEPTPEPPPALRPTSEPSPTPRS